MWIWSFKLPTHDEIKAVKAHLKKVDNAQEIVLQAMFDDLRSRYNGNLSKKKLLE